MPKKSARTVSSRPTRPTRPAPRVAVIDIGSNAARLLLARGGEGGESGTGGMGGSGEDLAVEIFARVPLPLGADVFGGDGNISRLAVNRLALTALGFRGIILGQEPDAWGAFATAALREAGNGREIANYLRRKAGVAVRILSGREEAQLVGRYVSAQFPDAPSLICADIGGGTSDLVFARDGRVRASASFRVGTARADKERHGREFARMEKWLAEKGESGTVVAVVGRAAAQAAELCGGLSPRKLKAWRRKIAALSPEVVASQFGMEPDRAASASAAALLYEFLLECAGAEKLQVARGGLPQALAAEMLREEMKMRARKKKRAKK